MKKFVAVLLTLALCLACFAGCTNNAASSKAADPSSVGTSSGEESDWAYIQKKGTLVVGVTIWEPFDYQDENKNWIGFDADFANAVAAKLGVKAEFIPIDWDYKATELDTKGVDCIWNGMTITDEVLASMDCTDPYLNNAQVVVVKADKADQYKTKESVKDLTFAVEAGSAGEGTAKDAGFKTVSVSAQSDALLEVKSGSVDACVIDITMAAAMTGKGTSYSDLAYTVELSTEQYGIGFRKGSDMVQKVNEIRKELLKDGTLAKIADTYGQTAALITD